MLFGDDVIEMKGKFCDSLWKVTILATPLRTADHFGFQCAVRACHAVNRLAYSVAIAAP